MGKISSCFMFQRSTKMAHHNHRNSKPSLELHFYGKHLFSTPPLLIYQEQLPLSSEQVCMRCAEHISKNLGQYFPQANQGRIGPKLLPLFGLYAADHDLRQWIPDPHIFEATGEEASCLKFYFRVRVQLARECIPEGLFCDYLFWQCAEDFLSGRLWSHYGRNNKISNTGEINKMALIIFMGTASYVQVTGLLRQNVILHRPLREITSVDKICAKLTLMNIHCLFPKKSTEALQRKYNMKDPIMRITSKNYMRTYIKSFFEKWGEENLAFIRLSFVTEIHKNVPFYLLEYYPTEKLASHSAQGGESSEMVIRPHQDGCHPGLHFHQILQAPLMNIFGADILDSGTARSENQTCRILIHVQHKPPMRLGLKDQATAKSFLSILETYCRMKNKYHETLNAEKLAAPTLLLLKELKCFGPMDAEQAELYLQKLREKNEALRQQVAFYILYQDTEEFNLLHATALLSEENRDGEIVTHDIHYSTDAGSGRVTFQMKVGHEDRLIEDKQQLKYCLTTTLGLGRAVSPRDEDFCGAMPYLNDAQPLDCYIYATAENEKSSSITPDLGVQFVLFEEEHIPQSSLTLIARGEYSDVYRFCQVDEGREAVMKKVTTNIEAVHASYRKGAELLLKLRKKCHFFLQAYGFTMRSIMTPKETSIIYECMPEGNRSLLQRLRDPSALKWLQVASVLKQLTDCLCYLKEAGIFYGNFCCGKILILKERDTALTIRLGDPSLSLFCNTLPINDMHNEQRLAWLAPELWVGGTISEATMESEVYAFGTTVWEILNHGLDPRQCISGRITTRDFFAEGNVLPDPKFQKVTGTAEAVDMVPGPQGDTQRWVNHQNFTAADAAFDPDTVNIPDTHPETAREVAVEQQGEIPPYEKVTLASSELESSLATGETNTTTLSGQREGEAAIGGKEPMMKVQDTVLKLMHDCWHRDPKQRPLPRVLFKVATDVEEMVTEIHAYSPLFPLQLLLETHLEAGDVPDRERGQALQKKIQEAMAKNEGKEVYAELLAELERELRQIVQPLIDPSLLTLTEKVLGKGEFGEVIEATLQEASETREGEARAKRQKVAVKRMNEKRQDRQELPNFLKEVLTICKLEHPNVVKLIGLVKGRDTPYQIVMEYADKGTLKAYVDRNSNSLGKLDFKKQLKGLAINIAEGMHYIGDTKRRIHADLAARNVLLFSRLGASGEILTAKISDFGLSRKPVRGDKGTYEYDITKSKVKPSAVPIFWMPSEVIEQFQQGKLTYTLKTDVWSFGVTLWEMFSGKNPDQEMNPKNLKDNDELVKEIINMMRKNYRLPKTLYCSKKMYEIMTKCWKDVEMERPDFAILVQMLDLTDSELDD